MELVDAITAYASEGRDQIDILPCVPEDAEKRHNHIKHLDQYDAEDMVVYLNDDGTLTYYMFQAPVRYKDKQGNYQSYENTLVEVRDENDLNKGYKYKNKSSDINILFPEHLQGESGVKLEKDGYYLELIPVPLLENDTELIEEVMATETPELSPTPSVEPIVSETPEISSTPSVEPTISETPVLSPAPSTEPIISEAPELSPTPSVETSSEITPSPTESPETSVNSGDLSLQKSNLSYNDNILFSENKNNTNAEYDKVWGNQKNRADNEVESGFKVKIKDDKYQSKDILAEYKSIENEDIRYSYSAINEGFKENIIIDKYTGQSEFDFVIIAPELELNSYDNKIIVFNDKDGNIVFTSNQMFAIDSHEDAECLAEDHYSEDITVEVIASNKGEHRIRVKVSEEFLTSDETIYPVYVDPTFTVPYGDVIDNFVFEYNSIGGYSAYHVMLVGRDSRGRAHGFVSFRLNNFISENIMANNITSAKYHNYSTGAWLFIMMYRMDRYVSPWICWRDYAASPLLFYSGTYIDSYRMNAEGWYDFDLTDEVQGWVKYSQGLSGGFPNYGIRLQKDAESHVDPNHRAIVTAQGTVSSQRPLLDYSI